MIEYPGQGVFRTDTGIPKRKEERKTRQEVYIVFSSNP